MGFLVFGLWGVFDVGAVLRGEETLDGGGGIGEFDPGYLLGDYIAAYC